MNPPSTNPTPKADSGAGATPRAICKNCGEEQHDQIDRICMTCGFAMLESVGPNSLPTPQQSDPALAAAEAKSPATRAELWITDAPDGMAFQCPDCESCATLGGNAAFHMQSKKHRMPKLVKWRPLAPAPAPEGRGETAETDARFQMLLEAVAAFSRGTIYAEDLKVQLLQEREQFRTLERERDEARAALLAADSALEEAGINMDLVAELADEKSSPQHPVVFGIEQLAKLRREKP